MVSSPACTSTGLWLLRPSKAPTRSSSSDVLMPGEQGQPADPLQQLHKLLQGSLPKPPQRSPRRNPLYQGAPAPRQGRSRSNPASPLRPTARRAATTTGGGQRSRTAKPTYSALPGRWEGCWAAAGNTLACTSPRALAVHHSALLPPSRRLCHGCRLQGPPPARLCRGRLQQG